ncbi:MAG: DUF4157 domain-containing protein [Gammaproteobacteria bacterium]|nr:DUF4157 domain-containing protein [Gammaproteobacteria bacterium]
MRRTGNGVESAAKAASAQRGSPASVGAPASACACGGGCPRCRSGIQTKLAVSVPGDPLEREADRVAERIVSGLAAMPSAAAGPAQRVQRVPALAPPAEEDGDVGPGDEDAEETGEDTVVRLPAPGGEGSPPGRPLESRLAARASGGRTLPPAIAQALGARMGADLSDVRIHDDAQAAGLAAHLQARAFTWRHHVYFAPGEYRPHEREGLRVLAHELVHVVQQGAVAPRIPAPLAPGAYGLRIVDEQGGEKFLGPPISPFESIPAGAAEPERTVPEERESETAPVQRVPGVGSASTVLIQRTATFTKPTVKTANPLLRVMKGLTPGLTTPEINGHKKPSGKQLLKALAPTKVKQTGSGGAGVTCRFDGFDIATTAEQIVSTPAPAGGWTATVGPAAAISSSPKCAKVAKLPLTMNALPSNADFVKRVQQSEDEHVADLRWLHARYLVPYDAFVNGLKGSGADLRACGQDLMSKLGFHRTEAALEFSRGWATSVEKLDGPLGTHTDTARIATNAACSAATLTVGQPKATKPHAGPGNVAPVNPTVTNFNPANVKVVGKDLKDGKTLVKSFGNAADATAALAVIRHYRMTSRNVIGSLEYFLVGKAAPKGALKGANEFSIDPKGFQVTFGFPNAGKWAITDVSAIATGVNVNIIADFGADRDEAYSAWSILSAFGFTHKGWVGGTRQKPEMTYFRV